MRLTYSIVLTNEYHSIQRGDLIKRPEICLSVSLSVSMIESDQKSFMRSFSIILISISPIEIIRTPNEPDDRKSRYTQ